MRKYFGVAFLAAGLTLLANIFEPRITGNVVLNNGFGSSVGSFIAVMFLAVSMFLMMSKVSLDALLIPCSYAEELTRKRARKAAEVYDQYPGALIIASGGNTPGLNPKYSSEAAIAYEELQKAGIDPSYVQLEQNSRDSFDNIRYSLEKIPDARNIGIVSNAHQIERLKRIIRKGQQEGEIPKDLKVYRIKTRETAKERLYEFPASLLTEYVLRTQGYKEGKMPEPKGKNKAHRWLEKKKK